MPWRLLPRAVNADRACPWREKALTEHSFGHILCLIHQYDRKDDDNDNSYHERQDHSHTAGSELFVHLPALPGQLGQRLVVQRGDCNRDFLQVEKVPQAILNPLVTEQGLDFANVAGAFGRLCRDLVPQLLDRY